MIDRNNVANLSGATVTDTNGKKVGTVGQVYVDQQDGTPNWLTVNTGLFGMSETFVPIDRANWDREVVSVPFENDSSRTHPGSTPTARSPRRKRTSFTATTAWLAPPRLARHPPTATWLERAVPVATRPVRIPIPR